MNNIVMTGRVLCMTPNIQRHQGKFPYSWERPFVWGRRAKGDRGKEMQSSGNAIRKGSCFP